MSTFTLPDNCTGINMQDGTEYKASGRKIRVDDPDHARALRRSWQKVHDFLVEGTSYPTPVTGVRCPTHRCYYTGFSWQVECPRCGATLIPE